ncbi:expressed unknown protein [Seminavis robusta]|uniref:Uncharacterized protein n=1 Tax=Seminavis robusta TaxID=568900 RepID=A0A9N8DUJ8_9STRA|nr:expressed unknown protein [Seminavis robusta]|eukprot:Sro301_g111890.1 n/a (362) ;mRNA; f:26750-28028
MVAINGDVKASGRTMSRSKSKQFTMVVVGLGLIALLLLRSTGSSAGSSGYPSGSITPPTTYSSDQRATSNVEYDKFSSRKRKPERRIRQISLIGERNSGTRWTWNHLEECFNHSIPVERHLTRYKHWFQYPNYTAYPHDTLVIAQFRNPYDWLKAMQRVPHHSPSHLKLDWKPFLTTPWTAPRLGADIEIAKTINESNNSTDTTPCQHNFIYQDIVSCVKRPLPESAYDHKLRFSEDTPFYEMRNDGSGLPFDSIMGMRAAKIENFLAVQDYPGIAAVWAVQYEYLLQRGTQHLVDRISEWTGIDPKCEAFQPQLRRDRPLEAEFVEYVTEHLNWTAEELIGYGKYKQRLAPKEPETESQA